MLIPGAKATLAFCWIKIDHLSDSIFRNTAECTLNLHVGYWRTLFRQILVSLNARVVCFRSYSPTIIIPATIPGPGARLVSFTTPDDSDHAVHTAGGGNRWPAPRPRSGPGARAMPATAIVAAIVTPVVAPVTVWTVSVATITWMGIQEEMHLVYSRLPRIQSTVNTRV